MRNLRQYVRSVIKEELSKSTKLRFGGHILTITLQNDNGRVYVYAEDEYGDTYADISTVLPHNPLIDAIWVERGGVSEKIADVLKFLKKTNVTTRSGMSSFIMYNVI